MEELDLGFDAFRPVPNGQLGYAIKREPYSMPTIAELSGMSVSQRIRTIKEIGSSNRTAKEDDHGLETATRFAAEEQAKAEEARARLEAAYARLGVAPPEVQGPQFNTSESVAAALGGLITGDFNRSNNTMFDIVAQRTERENLNRDREYQANRQTAELDARLAGDDLERSMTAAAGWDRYKLGRMSDLEERDIRRGELERTDQWRRDDRDMKLHDDALDRIKTATNPSTIPVMVREVNRMREKMGIPLITEEESAAMIADATEKQATDKTNKVWTRYNGIANDYTNRVVAYGGVMPQQDVDSFNERVAQLETETGMKLPRFVNPNTPTLRREDQEFDNALDREAEDRAKRESDARIAKMTADIGLANARLALDTDKWQNGEAAAPKPSEYTKQIADLRKKQAEKKANMDVRSERVRAIMNNANRTPEQEEEVAKLREEIKSLRMEAAAFEKQIQYNAELRKQANEEQTTVEPLGGGTLSGIIGGNRRTTPAPASPKPAPKPKPKPGATAKTTPSGNTFKRKPAS